MKFNHELKDIPVYVMPINVQFLFNDENRFNDLISKFITNFNTKIVSHLMGQKTIKKEKKKSSDTDLLQVCWILRVQAWAM